MATTSQKIQGGAAAAVLATLVIFTPAWEGTDYVAKPDAVGTGHPITWCHGQTNADRDTDHKVKSGQRFTKQECDDELKKSLPAYLNPVAKCLHAPVPVKSMASIVDAAYNAGPARVCSSAMVKHFNAGEIKAGCNAFDGWIVRGAGNVLPGLIARRAGELHGDKRKSERALCLEGLKEETDKSKWFYPPSVPPPAPSKPVAASKANPVSIWVRLYNYFHGAK